MTTEPGIDDLYREVILDHFRNPRHPGRVEDPDVGARGSNPLCGDELDVTLRIRDRTIVEIRTQGKGCSISQATASMLTEVVSGKTLDETRILVDAFKGVMQGGAEVDSWPELMDDLRSLEGVRRYPVRIKCALLPWDALLAALDAYEETRT